MVGDDREQTIRELQYAERKSPAVYNPARDLFLSVLRGQFDLRSAFAQIRWVPDETERKCARDVLEASKSLLDGASARQSYTAEPDGN
jgi:hypothetical protein